MIFKEELIAPCGMNCGICGAYLRKKNRCLGCRMGDLNKPISILNCKIRNCVKEKNYNFCYECPDFPCKNSNHLDKRYTTKYNMSMIENLKLIDNRGIYELLSKEEEKWTCPNCGNIISCHKGFCEFCLKK